MLRRYLLNANVGGVGRRGEIVEADPTLWSDLIDAGYMCAVDDDGERILDAPSWIVTLPRHDVRLGRHVAHDPRSRAFAAPPPSRPLVTTRHERRVPIFDQGQLGSCTMNAALGAMMTEPHYERARSIIGHDVTEADCVKAYEWETAHDRFPGQYPPDDTGSSGLDAAKTLKSMGLISEYRHAFNMHAALDALLDGPIIIGVSWYESFYEPADGLVTIADGSRSLGGHEVCVLGLDVEAGLIEFANSWGTSWGRDGYGFLGLDTFGRLLAEQGDATVFAREG